MKQTKLLPHKWQTVGFYMFVILIALSVITDATHNGRVSFEDGQMGYSFANGWQWLIVRLLMPLAYVLMAFSQEKQEDEWVSSVRSRSLIWGIGLYVVLGIVRFFVLRWTDWNFVYYDAPIPMMFYKYYNVGLFPLLYVICLKISLWIQDRRLSKSKESDAMSLRGPFMFPHVCQVIGIPIVVIMVLLEAYNRLFIYFRYSAGEGIEMCAQLILPVIVVIVALSRELVDDERVAAIRRSALVWTVIFYFIISTAWAIVCLFLHGTWGVNPQRYYLSLNLTLLLSWTAFMIYYLLIFKISLWINNKALDNEKE